MTQIHDYSFTRTSANITDDDLIDVDATDDGGTTWFSAKMTKAELFLALASAITNLYNDDGTLAEDRTFDLDGYDFHVKDGNLVLYAKDSNNKGFIIRNTTDVDLITIKSTSGDEPYIEVKSKAGVNLMKMQVNEPVIFGNTTKKNTESLRTLFGNFDKIETEAPSNGTTLPLNIKGTTSGRKYMAMGNFLKTLSGKLLDTFFAPDGGTSKTTGFGLLERKRYDQAIDEADIGTLYEIWPIPSLGDYEETGVMLQMFTSYFSGGIPNEGWTALRSVSDKITGITKIVCESKQANSEIIHKIWTGHSNSIYQTHGGRLLKRREVGTTQTLAVTDHLILIDTDGSIDITLPDASLVNEIILVRKGGVGSVSVLAAGINEINGLPNISISTTKGETWTLYSDGASWYGE